MICIYICTDLYTNMHVYMRTHLRISTHQNLQIHKAVYIYTHVKKCAVIYTRAHECVHKCVYTTCISTYVNSLTIYLTIHNFKFACVCMRMYIQTNVYTYTGDLGMLSTCKPQPRHFDCPSYGKSRHETRAPSPPGPPGAFRVGPGQQAEEV